MESGDRNQSNSNGDLINLDPKKPLFGSQSLRVDNSIRGSEANDESLKLLGRKIKAIGDSELRAIGMEKPKKNKKALLQEDANFRLGKMALNRGLVLINKGAQSKDLFLKAAKEKRALTKALSQSMTKARAIQKKSKLELEDYLGKLASELKLDESSLKTFLTLSRSEMIKISMKKLTGKFNSRLNFTLTSETDMPFITLSNNYQSMYGAFNSFLFNETKKAIATGSLEDVRIKKLTCVMKFADKADYLNALNWAGRWTDIKDMNAGQFIPFTLPLHSDPEKITFKFDSNENGVLSYSISVDGIVIKFKRIRIFYDGKEVFTTFTSASVETVTDYFKKIGSFLTRPTKTTGEEKSIYDIGEDEMVIGNQIGVEMNEKGQWFQFDNSTEFLPVIKVTLAPDYYGTDFVLFGNLTPNKQIITTFVWELEMTSSEFLYARSTIPPKGLRLECEKYHPGVFLDSCWTKLFDKTEIGFEKLEGDSEQRPLLFIAQRYLIYTKAYKAWSQARNTIRREFIKYYNYVPAEIERVDIMEAWEISKSKIEASLSKFKMIVDFISESESLAEFERTIGDITSLLATKLNEEGSEILNYIRNKCTKGQLKRQWETLFEPIKLDNVIAFCETVTSTEGIFIGNEFIHFKWFKDADFKIKISKFVEALHKNYRMKLITAFDYDSILGLQHFEELIEECNRNLDMIRSRYSEAKTRASDISLNKKEQDDYKSHADFLKEQAQGWELLLKKVNEEYKRSSDTKSNLKEEMRKGNITKVYELIRASTFTTAISRIKGEYMRLYARYMRPDIEAALKQSRVIGERRRKNLVAELDSGNLPLVEQENIMEVESNYNADNDLSDGETDALTALNSTQLDNVVGAVSLALENSEPAEENPYLKLREEMKQALLRCDTVNVIYGFRERIARKSTEMEFYQTASSVFTEILNDPLMLNTLENQTKPASETHPLVLREFDRLRLRPDYQPLEGLLKGDWLLYVRFLHQQLNACLQTLSGINTDTTENAHDVDVLFLSDLEELNNSLAKADFPGITESNSRNLDKQISEVGKRVKREQKKVPKKRLVKSKENLKQRLKPGIVQQKVSKNILDGFSLRKNEFN